MCSSNITAFWLHYEILHRIQFQFLDGDALLFKDNATPLCDFLDVQHRFLVYNLGSLIIGLLLYGYHKLTKKPVNLL